MARERVFRNDRLLKLLQKTEMKQEDFAAFLGMDQPQLNRYLNEGAEPTSAIVVRIAKKLDVTTDYLLGLSPLPNSKASELSGDTKSFDEGLGNKDVKTAIDLLSKKP